MSERGVFAIDRGLWDHPEFAPEPFTEREAWAWLISEASFKAHRRRFGVFQIDLKRGQIAASIRFLAEKWKWHRNKVDRFLERLRNASMIGTDTGTGINVITICNYDKYQKVSLPYGTAEETDAGQARDKVEYREYKEEDSLANAKGADAPPDPSIAEREFFKRGREVLGKNSGGMLAKLLKAKGGNVSLARSAVELAATKSLPAEFIGAICRGPPIGSPTALKDQKQQEWEDARQKLRHAAYGDDRSGEGGGQVVRLLPKIGSE